MPLKCYKTEESHEYLSFLVILQLLNQNQRWKCGYGAGIWTEIGERGITETSFSYEMKLWYHNGRAEQRKWLAGNIHKLWNSAVPVWIDLRKVLMTGGGKEVMFTDML